jgi:hypothetical protein
MRLLLTDGFTNGKDNAKDVLCEEAGNICPLQKSSHVEYLNKMRMTFSSNHF